MSRNNANNNRGAITQISDGSFMSSLDIDIEKKLKKFNNPSIPKYSKLERLLSVEKVEEYIRYVLDRIGRNRRGGLSEQLVAFIRAYSFYGWKNTNERNIKKTREFYREKARKAGQPWRAPELKKIQYFYNVEYVSLKKIIETNNGLLAIKNKWPRLQVLNDIIIPHMEFALKYALDVYKENHKVDFRKKGSSSSDIARRLQQLKVVEKGNNVSEQLLELKNNYGNKLSEYYLKNPGQYENDKNQLLVIKNLLIFNKSKETKSIKSKYNILSKTSNINTIKDIISRYNVDVQKLKLLKYNNSYISNHKKSIADKLKTALDRIITEKKTLISISGVNKNHNAWVKAIVRIYDTTPILNNSERASFTKKLETLKSLSEQYTSKKKNDQQKALFNAYLNEIKSSKTLNVSKIKKDIESETLNKSYKKRLITAINKRGSESRNIPYKIYNQIKNEQIKKFKKDGTPYPLDYFKSRYGYTNEQLKILESNYVNKLEDEYKEIDSKYIDELNRTQRQFYSGLINALRKLSRGIDTQTYSEMVSNALKTKKEKMQALKKEHSSKFYSELRKRSPNEIKMLGNKLKSYIAQYKKALRSTKIKLAAKKRASKKK